MTKSELLTKIFEWAQKNDPTFSVDWKIDDGKFDCFLEDLEHIKEYVDRLISSAKHHAGWLHKEKP